MSNKIGKLVTSWNDLEVGDTLVYEGYNSNSILISLWKFTEGTLYTVSCTRGNTRGIYDEDGDLYHGLLTHLKFRLVSKEKLAPFPSFDFKLRNGDKPEVRQWLEDNGVSWNNGSDPTTFEMSLPLLFVRSKCRTLSGIHDLDYFKSHPYKEIQLQIQPAKVVGYQAIDKVDKKTEKELQLEGIIAKLSDQLDEATTELNKLK